MEALLSAAEVLSCSRAESLSVWSETSEAATSHLTAPLWIRFFLLLIGFPEIWGTWEESEALDEDEEDEDLRNRASNFAPAKLVETAIESAKP